MSEILKGIVTEKVLLGFLGLTTAELGILRKKEKFPYIPLSESKRVYLERDLMRWFRDRRVASDFSVIAQEWGVLEGIPKDSKTVL